LPIPSGVWLQPDAYLYSQRYLMSLGLAVTWDNPDVTLTDMLGNVVGSHNLKPSTDYRITALIHNKANDAPAPSMPVVFTLLDFGAGGVTRQNFGTETVDLPVRAAPGEPVSATVVWKTPPTPGHYCIEIEAVWLDDVNPLDNVGQHNTVIRGVTPRERIVLPVPITNFIQGRSRLKVRLDSYVLPARPLIRDGGRDREAVFGRDSQAVRESDAGFLKRIIAENSPGKFPADPSWTPSLSAHELTLERGQSAVVEFEATVPASAASGQEQRFNIAVSEESTGRIIGGVTLIFQVT
ncbi:MAG: hypothetical protein WBL28_03695, partial [Methylotenera sp.]